MKIYDNFLDKEVFLKINKKLMGEDFFWNYSNGIDYDNQPDLFQFCHVFYDYNNPIIRPVLQKIKFIKKDINFLRVKCNLNPKTSEHIQLGEYHNDIKNVTTAIYYVNTNNGYTSFENGETIKSIENRLVIFDSNIKHVGFSCTDKKIRLVININFEKEMFNFNVPFFVSNKLHK